MRRYLVRVTTMKDVYVIAEDEDEARNEAEKRVAYDENRIDPHDIVDSEILEDSAVDKEDLYEG